jgi:DNA invertase Pin-like site-specific DNA recombinase
VVVLPYYYTPTTNSQLHEYPMSTNKHFAVYARVSTTDQTTASQMPELEAWAASQTMPIKFYEDTFSGRSMDREGWNALQAAVNAGKVAAVCVWRLDRLGRTASGLTKLFDELRERRINLISLRDGVDLKTSAGRLMANVLASVAQYETEIRGERVRAGQAAARARGVRWGGGVAGRRKKITRERAQAIDTMYSNGTPISRIAVALSLSRQTVRSVLKELQACPTS